jgi:hypothetical protein
LFGFRQRRQEHAGQDGDNRDDHEQFNQGEPFYYVFPHFFHKLCLLFVLKSLHCNLLFAVSTRFDSPFSTDDAIGWSLPQMAVLWPFPAFFAVYFRDYWPMRENSTHNA